MSAECCANCKFHDGKTGDCRRYPPAAQMIPTPQPNLITGKVEMHMSKWTFFPQPKKEMVKEIRCGEFKPRLTTT